MAEQRYQAVMAVISDGLSVSQAAEKVGVSRQTLLHRRALPAVHAALAWRCVFLAEGRLSHGDVEEPDWSTPPPPSGACPTVAGE